MCTAHMCLHWLNSASGTSVSHVQVKMETICLEVFMCCPLNERTTVAEGMQGLC